MQTSEDNDWGYPGFYRAFNAGLISQDQAVEELLVWMEQQRFWDWFLGKDYRTIKPSKGGEMTEYEARIKDLVLMGHTQKEIRKIIFQEFRKIIYNEADRFELGIMIREEFENAQ